MKRASARWMQGLLDRGRCQSGMAVPTATWVLFIMMLFAGTAGSSAIWATSQSSRDRESKRALAAAEGALDSALERLNSREAATDQCVGTTGAPTALPGAWCNVVVESGQLDNGTQARYRISGPIFISSVMVRKVVAVGSSGQRTKVITANLRPLGNPIFSLAAIALDLIVIDSDAANGNAWIIAPRIGTNGELRLNGRNSRLCGTAMAREVTYPGAANASNFNCNQPEIDPDLPSSLPTCSGAGCFSTVNPDVGFAQPPPAPSITPVSRPQAPLDNARLNQAFAAAGVVPSGAAACSPVPSGAPPAGMVANAGSSTSNILWNCNERTLTLRGNATLSLAGGEYLLCRLHIEDTAQLLVPNGNSVQFWMDHHVTNPAGGCPGTVGAAPFKLQGGGPGIVNGNTDPLTGKLLASKVALNGIGPRALTMGEQDCDNSNNPSARLWANDNTFTPVRLAMVINAPAWCVKIGHPTPGAAGRATVLEGAVISQILKVQGKGRLIWNDDATSFSPGQLPVYARVPNWHECRPIANLNNFTDTTC